MNIQIPQPTVLERLRKDLEHQKELLEKLDIDENIALFGHQKGYIQGIEWAIANLELDQKYDKP